MPSARTLLNLVAPNARPLWGIGWLRTSFGHFTAYAAIGTGIALGRPVVAGLAMVFALVVEASDVLAPDRRHLTLSDWRRGLDIRTYWRNLAFLAALASLPAPPEVIGAFASLALGAAVIVRVIRSDRLRLYAETLLRPIGAMREGVERLARARRVERRRDLSELWLQASVLVAAALFGLTTVTDLDADAAVAVGVGLFALALTNAGLAGLACRRHRPVMLLEHNDLVLAEFQAWDPEVVCYFNGHPGSTYGVDVWLRTFEECGRRVALVYRHRSVEEVDTDRLPGLVVAKDALVERIVSPSARVALYPANGTLNVHLQRDKRLAHVFIGHGDSDKAGSASPFTQSYDQVWVAGQAGIDRYTAKGIDIPGARFVTIGRPPLSPRVRAAERARDASRRTGTSPLDRLRDELARRGTPGTTVLYAPTWEGYFEDSDYSSVATMATEIVDAILERPGTTVVFKPHPLTGHRLPELLDVVEEIRHRLERHPGHHPSTADHPDVALYDWFDIADALVTDVSSLISDFMAWERPSVVTNPHALDADEFHERFPTTAAAYVAGPGQAGAALDDALGADPLAAQRTEVRRYYLGDPDRDPLDLFDEALDSLYRSVGDDA